MVSIIIPAYNAQAYLRECLESVLAQTYADWEVIIVNDGSTDSTGNIAVEYSSKDARIKSINTPNRGPAHARNTGLRYISGDWVAFLDSDDILTADALEICLNSVSGVDMVIGQSSRNMDYTGKNRTGPYEYRDISGRQALIEGLYQTGVTTSAWARLYRSDIVKDIKFPEGIYYEDLVYSCAVFLKVRKIRVISDVIYLYRNNPASILNTFSHKRLDALRATEMVAEMCGHEPELMRAAQDRRLSANFNMFGLLSLHDDGENDDAKERCWQYIKTHRNDSMRNPCVRMKNKLGIFASYFGKSFLSLLSKVVYK